MINPASQQPILKPKDTATFIEKGAGTTEDNLRDASAIRISDEPAWLQTMLVFKYLFF